jgi:hypothetical protein
MSSDEFEAPLAQNEDWADFGDFQESTAFDSNENIQGVVDESNARARGGNLVNSIGLQARNSANTQSNNNERSMTNKPTTTTMIKNSQVTRNDNDFDDSNFADSISGSLEDLVHSFDEKIIHCFQDYDEQVDIFAPVQVKSPEELLAENE